MTRKYHKGKVITMSIKDKAKNKAKEEYVNK